MRARIRRFFAPKPMVLTEAELLWISYLEDSCGW